VLRRSLATLILTISLVVGSLAWSGFVALRTVLDADRSQAVAEALYDDEAVRDQLAANIGSAVGATIPDGVPISQAQLDSAASTALDSPAVEALVVDAFVSTHRAFLGGGDAPDSLDAGAFGAAARAALVAEQPALDAVLPASPEFVVELPTDRVPNAGGIRDFLERTVPLLALAAAAGVLFALVATSDRPAVMRRAGYWAIGVSVVVLVFAFGVPWAAEQFAPDQSEVIAAIIGSLAATTRGPALAMAIAGAAAVAGSLVMSRAPSPNSVAAFDHGPRVAPPAMPIAPPAPPRAPRGGRAVRRDMPAGPSSTWVGPPTASLSPPPVQAPPPAQAPPPPRGAATVGGLPARPPTDPTDSFDPRWVDGQGWVIDPSSPDIPTDARWVPGVGYVTDREPGR